MSKPLYVRTLVPGYCWRRVYFTRAGIVAYTHTKQFMLQTEFWKWWWR